MNNYFKTTKLLRKAAVSTPLTPRVFNGRQQIRYLMSRWEDNDVCHS